ncbi:hypothetical protein AB1Y20_011404 [Prymnesium parvum]|uniref:Uncharacterized protein n=1 Tax=Prymnesium parvum TaxID=97485 RepID=A0AB34IMH7_PRYPA
MRDALEAGVEEGRDALDEGVEEMRDALEAGVEEMRDALEAGVEEGRDASPAPPPPDRRRPACGRGATLAEAGLSHGCSLALTPRAHALPPPPPPPPPPPAAASPCASGCGFAATWHATHCCSLCAMQRGCHGQRCDLLPAAPPDEALSCSPLLLSPIDDGGKVLRGAVCVQGLLSGTYRAASTAFHRAGLVLLCAPPGSAAEALLLQLQPHLRFQSFAFPLVPSLGGQHEQVRHVVSALRAVYPHPRVLALVGGGGAGSACLSYALRHPRAAAEGSGGRLVLVGAEHSLPADARHHRFHAAKHKPLAPKPEGWQMLSIHGEEDDAEQTAAALLFHLRHAAEGHALRVLRGASTAAPSSAAAVGAAVNDWLDGARRLGDGDIGGWADGAAAAVGLLRGEAADLSGRRLGGAAVDLLAAQLSAAPAATASLCLRRCAIGGAAPRLAAPLAAQRRLTRLDLSHNSLRAAVRPLARALRGVPSLAALLLDANGIGADAIALADLARAAPSLTLLHLAANGIDSAAAAALADALREGGAPLAELRLDDNEICARGAAAIGAALASRSRLTRLDLRANRLTPRGAAHLAAALAANGALRELRLAAAPPWGEPTVAAFAAALEEHHALTSLDLAESAASPAAAAIRRLLLRNKGRLVVDDAPAAAAAAAAPAAAAAAAAGDGGGAAFKAEVEAMVAAAVAREALDALLGACELGEALAEAREWCEAHGVASPAALVERAAPFAAALRLTQGRKLRLRATLRAHAPHAAAAAQDERRRRAVHAAAAREEKPAASSLQLGTAAACAAAGGGASADEPEVTMY